jgi:hypothetical protein
MSLAVSDIIVLPGGCSQRRMLHFSKLIGLDIMKNGRNLVIRTLK